MTRPEKIARLRISLKHIEPEIWRLVEVPLGMSLKGLHDVIRAAGCLRRNSTLTRFFIAYNSCRNRHCPKCEGAAAKEWLADREAELLPVP